MTRHGRSACNRLTELHIIGKVDLVESVWCVFRHINKFKTISFVHKMELNEEIRH